MTKLINSTYEIIKCYRTQDEGEFMSKEIITNWINQFNEEDREFILSELIHILKQRYITKNQFKEYLKKVFFEDIRELIPEEFGQMDMKEILKRIYFIDNQPAGKSQKAVIRIIEELIQEKLGLTLADCGKKDPSCYVYLDDVLCTGDTIFKGIEKEGWLNKNNIINPKKTNRDVLIEKKRPIFISLYSAHLLNAQKLHRRMDNENEDNKDLTITIFCHDNYGIDNRYDSNSKLQFIFPLEDEQDELITGCKKQIEDKVYAYCKGNNYKIPTGHFYRSSSTPKNETFFSSAENRNRFEKIILRKSIEIYNKANLENLRMKPLGYGLYTDKSFGYGTLVFTWRNVPLNTPLVFWYEHNGWNPLFKRHWSSYKKTLILRKCD